MPPSPPARGQALVEFALVLPILVLLLAGIVDLTNGYQTYVSLTNAAREGAAYQAYPSGTSTACARAQQALPNTISVSCSNTSASCAANPNICYPGVAGDTIDCLPNQYKAGCPIRFRLTYALSTWMGGVLGFGTITLSPSTDMMVISTGS